METEEEPDSNPPNPAPSGVENDSATSTDAPAEADEPETERLSSDSCEPPPGGGGDSESQLLVSSQEVGEATVVDELEERVLSVAGRSQEELAGEVGGEECWSVEAEVLSEVTVGEGEGQGGDVLAEKSGIAGVEKGSNEAEGKKEENLDNESGGLADVEVAVKEENESEAALTREVEELATVEKVEETENEEAALNAVAESVDGSEEVDRVSVDDAREEMKGDEGRETASVGRSTEEVEEIDVDDALVEKDKEGRVMEELDAKEDEGEKVVETGKEAEMVGVVEEEVAKVDEVGEGKCEEMNEQAEKVNDAAEEGNGTQGQEEEVEDNDDGMNGVGEEVEKVNEADDNEEEDAKVNEAYDEEVEEDEKVSEADEEEEVEEEDAQVNEADDEEVEEDEKASEADDDEVEEEDAQVSEADDEDVEEDEKVSEADEEEEVEEEEKVSDADDEEVEEDEKVSEAEEEEEEEVEEEEDEKGSEPDADEEENDDDDEKMNEAEETIGEEGKEVAEEVNVEEVSKTRSGKRKRGNSTKAVVGKAPSRKKVEEDVCFICFDGGELVLCDRRGCPKAYHPSCVNSDEAFFKAKGKWNCGWHICSNCEKNAYYMCYMCTFSLCKGCIKDGVILCVRGNKGFCETCFKTVEMIEMNKRGDKGTTQVDFDDKSSWEYLFKDYWIDLKARLSITSDELTTARHLWRGSDSVATEQDSGDESYDAQNDGESASDCSTGNGELRTPKGRKGKKRLKSRAKQKASSSKKTVKAVGVEWASKELLDFVMYMKNGDTSVCSQFDVQALLLEYIKRNKRRDPRRKSQILCDSRLQHLFGRPRVGHFEMLKLLESHFLLKEDPQMDDVRESVDPEANQVEGDGDALGKAGKDKKKKSRKKGDGRGLQSNLCDFGAIDTHNITLIYLKRSLVEELLDDSESFNEKVVGSFVRLRISGNSQKQDLYRLVQIVGTCTKKADAPYKVGKRTANFLLGILNLSKTEVIPLDAISNQEFTEDECKRLRQSIKCGLLNRLTVGDIQEKAIALQAVRVQDTLESEITRVSHLRDRASDMGKRKELRECVEKLQLLKSPDERQRRLEEIPEIHVDPNMDPNYESEEVDETDDKRRVDNYRPRRSSGFGRRPIEPISSRKGATNPSESWGRTRSFSSTNRELARSLSSKGFSYKDGDKANDNSWSLGRDREVQAHQSCESPRRASHVEPRTRATTDSASRLAAAHEISPAPSPSTGSTRHSASAKAKIWYYRDPAGKVQGPFSKVQLLKWHKTGYFPTELRIWRGNEKEDESIFLTNVLDVDFQAPMVQTSSLFAAPPPTVEIPNYPADSWNSEASLPSPTPSSAGSRGGTKRQARQSRWAPTPAPAAATAATNPSHVASPVARQASAVAPPQMHPLAQIDPPRVVPSNSNHFHRVPSSSSAAPVVPAAMNTAALQSLVQTISNHPLLGGTQGNVSRAQAYNLGGSMQPSNWGNPPAAQAQWGGMGVSVTAANNPGGQWGGNLPPATANPGFGMACAAPNHANVNPNWMQGQQVVARNTNTSTGLSPTVQGWIPGSAGRGSGAAAQTMNANQNPRWVAPRDPNNPTWERGDSVAYPRDDRGRQWNRQSSSSSRSLQQPPTTTTTHNRGGQRVCWYFHKTGHCRKGASCEYLHT